MDPTLSVIDKDGTPLNEHMGYNNATDEVKEMFSVHITGDVIPTSWWKELTMTSIDGKTKPDMDACLILSTIVYWYRPTLIRDEQTDEIVGYRKKFYGEFLQKSYQDLADKYGISKYRVKKACDRLEKRDLIKRHFCTITTQNSKFGKIVANNVLYIELNVSEINKISAPRLKNHAENSKKVGGTYDKSVIPSLPPRHGGTNTESTFTKINKEQSAKSKVLRASTNKLTNKGARGKNLNPYSQGVEGVRTEQKGIKSFREEIKEAQRYEMKTLTKKEAEDIYTQLENQCWQLFDYGKVLKNHSLDQEIASLPLIDCIASKLNCVSLKNDISAEEYVSHIELAKKLPTYLLKDSLEEFDTIVAKIDAEKTERAKYRR